MASNKILSHEPFRPGSLTHGGLQIDFNYQCVDCEKPFEARTGFALRCPPCRKIHDKEYQRKYYQNYYKNKKK